MKNCWRGIKRRGAERVAPAQMFGAQHRPVNGSLLCIQPYPCHPHGCPNFGHKPGCPPAAKPICDVLDLHKPVWAIWTVFDFARHLAKMGRSHGEWSERQKANCRYWQATARRALEGAIAEFILAQPEPLGDILILRCPEAHGVNVTATMATLGEKLEWPPCTETYQVALIGYPKEAAK
jgi:hypothetical protein